MLLSIQSSKRCNDAKRSNVSQQEELAQLKKNHTDHGRNESGQ